MQYAREHGVKLLGLEIDLTRSEDHDLRSPALWTRLAALLKEADAVLLAPPCNTFSRARANWRTSPGPPPLRSLEYLFGSPWLSHANKSLVEDANFLVLKSFEFCLLCLDLQVPLRSNIRSNSEELRIWFQGPFGTWRHARVFFWKRASKPLLFISASAGMRSARSPLDFWPSASIGSSSRAFLACTNWNLTDTI